MYRRNSFSRWVNAKKEGSNHKKGTAKVQYVEEKEFIIIECAVNFMLVHNPSEISPLAASIKYVFVPLRMIRRWTKK